MPFGTPPNKPWGLMPPASAAARQGWGGRPGGGHDTLGDNVIGGEDGRYCGISAVSWGEFLGRVFRLLPA